MSSEKITDVPRQAAPGIPLGGIPSGILGPKPMQMGQAGQAPSDDPRSRWPEKLRLLPVLMFAAALTFGVKLGNIWDGADAFVTGVPAAMAEDDVDLEDHDAVEDSGQDMDDHEVADDHEALDDHEATSVASDEGWDEAEPYSQGELQLLENLADRRIALDERAREIEMRERVLTAMELRIDEKIAEVKSIEEQVASYLNQYDTEHLENMKSLVKMYETMKPKDAARIFEQLHMDILLNVAGNMKESKMASVLAAMSPESAKTLTVELATQKPIPLAYAE